MLIPLTDPENEYTALMLHLLQDHRRREAKAHAPIATAAPEAVARRPEARAREVVSRAFARRYSAIPTSL